MSAEMSLNSLLVLSAAPFSGSASEGEGEGRELWQHGGGEAEKKEKAWNEWYHACRDIAEQKKLGHGAGRNKKHKNEEWTVS